MIFLLSKFRRILCKPSLFILFAFSSSPIFYSVLYANVSLYLGAPRGGGYSFFNSTGGIVSVLATDTDESSMEILSTSEEFFYVEPFFTVADQLTSGGSGRLTVQPHDLDAGDWAHAIAVFQNGSPLAFFQVRIAGSSAEVMDSSLASAAVAANLWTSTDDYFEFNPGHAGVELIGSSQTGPDSFNGFVMPEPSTMLLLLSACCFPARLMRRNT